MSNVQRQMNRRAQRAIEGQLKESRNLQMNEFRVRLQNLEQAMGQVVEVLMNTQVNGKPILAIERKTGGGILLPGRS